MHVFIQFGNEMVSHKYQGNHSGQNVKTIDNGLPSFTCASCFQQEDESQGDGH